MTEPLKFSPQACYLWQVFDGHGDSDDLGQYYGHGEPVGQNLVRDVNELRRLYPELAGWGLVGLFWAWGDFETDHLLVGSSAPYRDEMFLGYIILRSVAGFKADAFGDSWAVINQALRWRDGTDALPVPINAH